MSASGRLCKPQRMQNLLVGVKGHKRVWLLLFEGPFLTISAVSFCRKDSSALVCVYLVARACVCVCARVCMCMCVYMCVCVCVVKPSPATKPKYTFQTRNRWC